MIIKPEDLVVNLFPSTAHGYTTIGVRLIHLPTCSIAMCDNQEIQEDNHREALRLLTLKVESIQAQIKAKELSDFDIDAIADKVIKPIAGERISYAQARKFARAILAAVKG